MRAIPALLRRPCPLVSQLISSAFDGEDRVAPPTPARGCAVASKQQPHTRRNPRAPSVLMASLMSAVRSSEDLTTRSRVMTAPLAQLRCSDRYVVGGGMVLHRSKCHGSPRSLSCATTWSATAYLLLLGRRFLYAAHDSCASASRRGDGMPEQFTTRHGDENTTGTLGSMQRWLASDRTHSADVHLALD